MSHRMIFLAAMAVASATMAAAQRSSPGDPARTVDAAAPSPTPAPDPTPAASPSPTADAPTIDTPTPDRSAALSSPVPDASTPSASTSPAPTLPAPVLPESDAVTAPPSTLAPAPAPSPMPEPVTAAVDAPPPAPAVRAVFTLDTPIQDLIADPGARAVLDKDLPGVSDDDNLDKFKALSLRSFQPLTGGQMTDAMLAKVASDLDVLAGGSGAVTAPVKVGNPKRGKDDSR